MKRGWINYARYGDISVLSTLFEIFHYRMQLHDLSLTKCANAESGMYKIHYVTSYTSHSLLKLMTALYFAGELVFQSHVIDTMMYPCWGVICTRDSLLFLNNSSLSRPWQWEHHFWHQHWKVCMYMHNAFVLESSVKSISISTRGHEVRAFYKLLNDISSVTYWFVKYDGDDDDHKT